MAPETALRARIAHDIPGRLRLRLSPEADVDAAARQIEAALAALPGIVAVEPRPGSRSLLILYNPSAADAERLIRAISPSTIEFDVSGAADGPRTDNTKIGEVIVRAIGNANQKVGRATAGVFDLRDVFPLTLFTFGLRRVAQGQVQPVPWYNLLYYGYSTFVALHARRGAAGPNAIEIARRRYALGELSAEEYHRLVEDLHGSARQ